MLENLYPMILKNKFVLYDNTCMHVVQVLKVPAVLHRKLSETFKCNIPAFRPVIFARCCKSIVVCRACGLVDFTTLLGPLSA